MAGWRNAQHWWRPPRLQGWVHARRSLDADPLFMDFHRLIERRQAGKI
ncbi:MAG: hypothetical protein WC485_02385 [Opitutaceae bacterium]